SSTLSSVTHTQSVTMNIPMGPVHRAFSRTADWTRERPEAKRRKREEQPLHLTARVVTDDTFARHEGFDLATFDDKSWPQLNLPSFCVLKQEPYNVFKSRVAARFQLPENKVRLWVLVNRQNKTVRPDMPIPENWTVAEYASVEAIRHNMAARQKDLRLYLDVIPDPSKSKQSLFGVGKVYVSRNSKVQDLHPIINERMRWTSGTPLRLYESMKAKCTIDQSEIPRRGLLTVYLPKCPNRLRDLEKLDLYSNPVQFYGFLQNRVTIFFRPRLGRRDNDHPEFRPWLHQMSQKAGEYLRHDPIKLRFTTTHAASGAAKEASQKLTSVVTQPEAMRSLKVIWIGIQTREDAPLSRTGKIRVFEVSKDGKTKDVPDQVDLYAEVWAHTRTYNVIDFATQEIPRA
ncbi:ICP0-binding domain of ubiquitin-specific protease 7-domain-containing protein, partial [Pisolithus microcarpus]